MPDGLPENIQEELLLAKEAFPTSLRSREIRFYWTKAMRDKSFFSARTTSKEYLEKVKELLHQFQTGVGVTPDGRPISQDIDRTRMLMREKLNELGMLEREEDGTVAERMTNLGSTMRLNLIIETNTKAAHAKAQKMVVSDPLQKLLRPAWELVRNQQSNHPRNWRERWYEAASICNWEGVARGTTRMVALVDSPIWEVLGNHFADSIGIDTPPFWWGSGSGWRPVDRTDCIQLGLVEDMPRND